MESYALKELSEAEMRRVEKHVSSCPKCRFFLEEQLGWASAMRSPFRRQVEKLIETERKKHRSRKPSAGTEEGRTADSAGDGDSVKQAD